MRIISFAWTVKALLENRKTQTRRSWKVSWAKKFKKGDLIQAYDKNPRAGGKPIAIIRLTKDPYLQFIDNLSDEDFKAEGDFHTFMSKREFILSMKASYKNHNFWVIEFELVKVL